MYVPESEVNDYRRHCSQDVVGVPVSGITKTRNWILDNTDSPRVVMIDDDVESQGWIRMQGEKSKKISLSEDRWLAEFDVLFDVAEDMGRRVWGISTDGAPCSVHTQQPFLSRSYLTASCLGILNHTGIRFDERFVVKEDYELGLRCVKEDGGFVAARYLFWRNSHWSDDGGCKEYRTQLNELKAIKMLQEMYPGMIKQIKRGGCDYSISIHAG